MQTATVRQVRMKLVKRLISACVALTLCCSHAVAPALASGAIPHLNLPSMGTVAGADLTLHEERELGEQLMQRIRSADSYLTDAETLDYLSRLGHRLVVAGGAQPFNFFFFPVREKSLNAFALPGGFIAVHTGLIVAARTESELAGVIGHEIGHVTQRHIARTLEQNKGSLAMTIGSLLLALLAARAGGSSGGDAAMAAVMGTQAALIQKQLAYSRDAEREADRVGLLTLTNAGFDPNGMQAFFERLNQANRQYESPSLAYLSTHPLTSERMSDMQLRTRAMPKQTHVDSLDFLLIQQRSRVLQETRYDGWLSVSKFFENNLTTATGQYKAAYHYGLSVALSRMNKKHKALEHARLAVQSSPQHNVLLDKNLAQAEFEHAKTPQEKDVALLIAKQMTQKHPYSTMVAETYADLLSQAGRHQEVVRYLRHQEAITKYDPDYHALLARSYEALGQRSLFHAATGNMYALIGNDEAAAYQFALAQKAADGDFYVMSEIDAKLREYRRRALDKKKNEAR